MTNANSKYEFKLGKADFLIVAASILGMAIMVYLTYVKFSSSPYFCDISAKISCSVVNQSAYAELLGIPVSVLGFIYFALVGGIIFNRGFGGVASQLIFFITLASLLFSLYLSYVEVFLLKTICLLCETSKVLILAIGIVSFSGMRHRRTARS
uniref:Vitamin K epoxide reductase family protein n=1 Tax=candidate division WWE3 bacterium TaxID=2053526 RepID=A0A832DRM5_UNCKA